MQLVLQKEDGQGRSSFGMTSRLTIFALIVMYDKVADISLHKASRKYEKVDISFCGILRNKKRNTFNSRSSNTTKPVTKSWPLLI